MKRCFIDYAMSVIVSRALPDVRDGLKPVHRRILYTMYEDNLTPDRPYRKSATTVGDVLGRYHPHGDASVYDALVRMAQDFSLRYPLVDGQGNFGSIDGDAPAAYRYTEARMSKISVEMLTDIEKDTIDYTLNYDEKHKEPTVLPSRFPNLLVNGSTGIAVGMATSIPPHNLGDTIDAVLALMDDRDISVEALMEIIKGPDFPTGGIIMGMSGLRSGYLTGRGKVRVRARAEIEEHGEGRFRIVVTEIPYMVNKARLIESIAELIKDKRIEGVHDLRDESDREGLRIVVELKRDANPQVILNQLFRYTQMEDTFSINLLALVNNQPKVLNLKEMLAHYLDFQQEVIVRRTRYDLRKAEERAHILEGLRIALDFIDEVIAIIRAAKSIPEAKEGLMARFGLTDIQAQAIVDMRLGRLTGLERDKIESEYAELMEKIADYRDILANEWRVLQIIRDELTEIRRRFSDERRTGIEPYDGDIDLEDLISEHTCVYTMTHFGYIKRLPLDTYRTQRRGGRGVTGITTREEDFVEELFVGSTHDYILFFTTKGRVYRLKGYEIPEAGRTAKGTNLVNLLETEPGEKVSAMIPVSGYDEDKYLTMVTRNGTVKRTALSEYDSARKAGLIAIRLSEDDELVRVKLTGGNDTLIIGTRLGYAIHFSERDVRPMGRAAYGVRGIRLKPGDYVVGMSSARPGASLLTVTENGYGKRTPISEYGIQRRGGQGLINYHITEKTGPVAGIRAVDETDDVMLISSDGVVIRVNAGEISEIGRATQGVRVMRLSEDVRLIAMARTPAEDDDEDDIEPEENGEQPAEEKTRDEDAGGDEQTKQH